jgi:Na+(H+)/acetate symporter ActP
MADRLDAILEELPPDKAAEARRILDGRAEGLTGVLLVIALIAAVGLAAALAIVSRLDPQRP